MRELRRREAERGTGTNLTTEQFDKLREDTLNSAEGNLPGDDCQDCHRKGWIYSVKNGVATARECSCSERRKGVKRLAESGMSGLLKDCTFATYQTPEQWQKEAKQKALGYVDDNHNKWFVVCGSVGSGKTHLCTAICGALLDKGKFIRYMRWRDDSVRLKAAVNDDGYAALIAPYQRCQVLYIDDLFKGGATEADKKLAFQILDYRYSNRHLATIISCEKTPEELLALDEATGSRIWERSKNNCIVVKGSKNWRLK